VIGSRDQATPARDSREHRSDDNIARTDEILSLELMTDNSNQLVEIIVSRHNKPIIRTYFEQVTV